MRSRSRQVRCARCRVSDPQTQDRRGRKWLRISPASFAAPRSTWRKTRSRTSAAATAEARRRSHALLQGAKGVAAGAGLAALVPLTKKGIDLVRSPDGAASGIGDKLGGKFKDTISEKVDEAVCAP